MKNSAALQQKIKDVFFGLYLLQLFNYIAPVIIIPIIINHLGLIGFGELVYITSIYQVISLGIDYGFTYTAPVMAAKYNGDDSSLKRYYCQIAFLKISLYVFLCVVACILTIFDIIKLSFDYLYVIFFCCLGNVITPLWLFQGTGNFKLLSNVQIVSRIILFLGLLSYLYLDGKNLIFISMLQNGTLILCAIFLRKKLWLVSWSNISLSDSINEFKKATNVFIGVLGTIGYGSLIPILIGNYCGHANLAVYSVVQKLTAACQSLINPVSQYMLSEVSKVHNENKLFYSKIKKSIYIHLGISIVSCIGYLIFGTCVAKLIGKVDVAFSIIAISSLITIFSSLNNVLGVQMLIPKNEIVSLRTANVMSGIIVASISYLIITHYNVLGGVLLNLIGESLVFLFLALIAIRKWGK